MRLCTKLPDEMNDDERLEEVAFLLARAVGRMHSAMDTPQKHNANKKSSIGLPASSKHSCLNNKKFSKQREN